MATAAETQSIIQLVVGMVNAAPGADILLELEDIIDSGLTIEELAIAISENPAFSGDTGLFPDYLPNAIFAEEFLTALLGDEVTEEVLEAAVDEMTASLNAGDSRGATMNAAIDSLAESTDPDFADAQAALANKTAVATYYSVELAVSSEDLDDLIAVVSGVTSDVDAVEDGEDAVDTSLAANADLSDLAANLDAANAAKAAFLKAEKTTDAAIDAGVAAENAVLDPLVAAPLAATNVGDYNAASAAVKAALLGDANTALGLTLIGQNKTTTAAAKVTAAKTGLDAAIAVFSAATTDLAAKTLAETVANNTLDSAIETYDAQLTSDIVTVLPAVDNALLTVADGVGNFIVPNALDTTGYTAKLGTGVTEATHPGSAVFLAALNTWNAAVKAQNAAVVAEEATQNAVENLDLLAGTTDTRITELGLLGALFSVVAPAKVATPTTGEIAAEDAALGSLLSAANAAAVAEGVGHADLDDALVVVRGAVTGIGSVTFGADEAATEAAHNAITATAVADGYITAGDKTKIDAEFALAQGVDGTTTVAAIAASQAELDLNNASARDAAFTAKIADVYAANDGVYPATTALLVALGAAAATTKALAAIATATADLVEAQALEDTRDDLDDVIGDAEDAFTGAGFSVPNPLDAAVEAGTAADDVFMIGTINSQIIGFNATGDDLLFIGADLTLNTGDIADNDDEGDDAVLEYWVESAGGSTTIVVETSVFGSSAADQEVVEITLTGVAAVSVSDDGFVTI